MATVREFEHGGYAIGGTEVWFPPFAWTQCTDCEQRIWAGKLQSSKLPRVPDVVTLASLLHKEQKSKSATVAS